MSFIKKNWFELVTVGTGAIINAILWFMALFLFPQDKLAAILHYNTSTGIDFIGESGQIKVIPAIGTAILVLNVMIALLVRRASKQAPTMFLSIIPLIEGLLLVAFLFILRLNQ